MMVEVENVTITRDYSSGVCMGIEFQAGEVVLMDGMKVTFKTNVRVPLDRLKGVSIRPLSNLR